MSKKLILFIFIILSIELVYATDFTFSYLQRTTSPYKGDLVDFKGSLTSDNSNYCPIECAYNIGTYSGYVSDTGDYPSTRIYPGNTQEFPFKLRAEGESGIITQTMALTCSRVANYINCWPDTLTNTGLVVLYFYYAGDKICTTSKEKCANYQSFLGTSDCNCPFTKECRPDGTRNPDSKGCQSFCGNGLYESEYENCTCVEDFTCDPSMICNPNNNRALDSDGCATFCGNGACEPEYENCSSCPKDCKKCVLASCNRNSDCSGHYCVWGVCWDNYYRKNDGHCDHGENCANSPSDCQCSVNQRCNNAGYCETYCGNGVCESNEIGTCSLDCEWCGDGICQEQESCSKCEQDCGACRQITSEEEFQRNNINDNPVIINSEPNVTSNINQPSNISINITDNLNENLSINQTKIINSNVTEKTSNKVAVNKNQDKSIFIVLILFVTLIILIFLAVYLFNKPDKKEQINCPKCKKKIDSNSRYCTYCGKRIK